MSSTTSSTVNPSTNDGAQLKYLALITLIIPFGIICFVLYMCYDRRQRRSQMMAIKLSGERCVGEPDNQNINQALAAGDDDEDAPNNHNERCTIGNYNPRLVWPNSNTMRNVEATLQENMKSSRNRREHSDSESTFDPLGHEEESQLERRARRRLRMLEHENVMDVWATKSNKPDLASRNSARLINLYSPGDRGEGTSIHTHNTTVTKSNIFSNRLSSSKCAEQGDKDYYTQKIFINNNNINLANQKYVNVDDSEYESELTLNNSEESSDVYGPIYAQSLIQTKGTTSSAEILQKFKSNVATNKLPTTTITTNMNGVRSNTSMANNSKYVQSDYSSAERANQPSRASQTQNDDTQRNLNEVNKEYFTPVVRHYDPTMYNATTQVLINMHQTPIEARNNSVICVSDASDVHGDNNSLHNSDNNKNNNTTTSTFNASTRENHISTFASNNVQKERSLLGTYTKTETQIAKQNLATGETSSSSNYIEREGISCATSDDNKVKEAVDLTQTVASHKRTLSDALRRKEGSAFENILCQASLPPVVPKELHGKSTWKVAQQDVLHSNATDNLRAANYATENITNVNQANKIENCDNAIIEGDSKEESYEYETADTDDVDGSGGSNSKEEN